MSDYAAVRRAECPSCGEPLIDTTTPREWSHRVLSFISICDCFGAGFYTMIVDLNDPENEEAHDQALREAFAVFDALRG